MSGTDYVIAPQIPRGLAPAIEGLAREILRKRPRDIYTFAARHFEHLVKLREKERGVKSADRKSYRNDYVFDWIDRNEIETQKRIVKDLRKYTHSLNEEALAKGQCIISTIRQAKPRRKERESLNESGWSINRTVKVFKEYEGEAGKRTRKLVREPHVSGFDSKRATRTGSTLKNIKRPVDKLYRSAGDEYRQDKVSSSLKRQRSADQIEASENATLFVNRRRSRSLANNDDRNENARSRCAEELPRKEEAAKLNLRLDKKNGEEPKDRGEKYTVESRSNNVFDQAIVNVTTVVSVVLPSVITRQSSGNSVKSEAHESNDEYKSSLILPPITIDPGKSVKKESNLTLPSLSNEADGRPISGREDGLGLGPKEKESTNFGEEFESKKETHLRKYEDTLDANKSNETSLGVTKDLLEVEAEEHFQDSLNVTPDPIDHSQRADSLEQIETEDKDESPNELKRKLIEIETVEKSIESALASSRSNVRFDHQTQATGIERERDSSEEEKETRVDEDEQIKGEIKSDSVKDKDSTKENEEEIEEVLEVPVTSGRNILKKFEDESIDDPSCYILKEGSPCEIPETVTTVIIPDKVPSEIEDLNTIDDLKTLEDFQHDERFGEYIGPEAHDYPSEVDAHFLRDVKTAAYQNLGNIKEEEESNEFAGKHDFDLLSSRTVESGDEDSVEAEEKSSDLKRTSTDGVKEDKSLQTSIKTAEKETIDDRSSDVSLSLEKSGPQIPELNLDSLQDLTVSSFERNDSKNLETEKENDSTTVYEEENGSLSSSENSSERKSSSKVESKEDEEKSESQDKLVTDIIRDESTRSLEEEIAKELIENFIRDESIHKTNMENEDSETNNVEEISDANGKEDISGTGIEESDDTKKVKQEEPSQKLISTEIESRKNEETDNKKEMVIGTHIKEETSGTNIEEEVSERDIKEDINETNNVEEISKINGKEQISGINIEELDDTKKVQEEPSQKLINNEIEFRENEETDKKKEMVIGTSIKEEISGTNNVEEISKTSDKEETSGTSIEKSDDTKKLEEEASQKLISIEIESRENEETGNEKEKEEIQEIESSRSKVEELSEKSDSEIVEPIQEHLHQVVIEEIVEENSKGEEEEKIKEQEREEIQIKELNDEKEKYQEMDETPEAPKEEKRRFLNYRHTGEFHDSIPLPLIEFPKHLYRKMSPIDNEESTNVPSTSSYDGNPELTVPYIIDLLGKYRSIDKKPNLAGFINISPYIIRFENVLHEPQTVDKPVVSVAETSSSFSSDTDDLREPLALDNTPQPVIIEEITNDDDDDEEKGGSHAAS